MKPMGGRTWKYWPASGPVFLFDLRTARANFGGASGGWRWFYSDEARELLEAPEEVPETRKKRP